MKKRNVTEKFLRFIKLLYIKLFRINDSPHRIALGLGMGAFLGILPGTGPIAALFFAFVFRINRAAAFLGCLLTNTWLSVVSFLFSIKIGSLILGLDWRVVRANYQELLKDFHWSDLLQISILKILMPVITGYLVISIVLALIFYSIVIVLLTRFKRKRTRLSSF